MQHQDEVSFSSRQLLPTNATRATTASDNHYRIQHVGATMTKHSFLFSLIYIAYISSACAFSIPKNAQTAASKPQMSTTNLGVSSSTKKEDLSSMKAVATETSSSFVTEDVLDSELVDEIREELLHKYLAQGISRDSAIREIDSFIQDKERSRKYMEMRAYASKAKGYDLGIGEGLNYVIAFLVGILGISVHNSINN